MKLHPKSHFGVKELPEMALQYSLGKQVSLSPVTVSITPVQHWSTQQF